MLLMGGAPQGSLCSPPFLESGIKDRHYCLCGLHFRELRTWRLCRGEDSIEVAGLYNDQSVGKARHGLDERIRQLAATAVSSDMHHQNLR